MEDLILALGAGEVEALHWISTMKGVVLLTDDAAARLAAVEMGHRVHGSISVLLRAVRHRRLPIARAEELVRSIPKRSTLHLHQDLLEAVLRELQSFRTGR